MSPLCYSQLLNKTNKLLNLLNTRYLPVTIFSYGEFCVCLWDELQFGIGLQLQNTNASRKVFQNEKILYQIKEKNTCILLYNIEWNKKKIINAAGSFGDLNCKNVRFLTFNRNGIYFLSFGSLSIDCSTKTCILSWKYMFHNFSELLYKTIFRFGHSIGYYGIVEYDVSYEIEKKGKKSTALVRLTLTL